MLYLACNFSDFQKQVLLNISLTCFLITSTDILKCKSSCSYYIYIQFQANIQHKVRRRKFFKACWCHYKSRTYNYCCKRYVRLLLNHNFEFGTYLPKEKIIESLQNNGIILIDTYLSL